MTLTQEMRGRPVTSKEAQEACNRLINSHFRQPDRARVTIPGRVTDDDILLSDYLLECAEVEAEHNSLRAQVAKLEEEAKEHDFSFDLRWNADRRAIKRWQAAHPGKELVWPDHADLCVWLLEQLTSQPSPDQTHWEGCWRHHGHHACAIARVEELGGPVTDEELESVGLDRDLYPPGVDEILAARKVGSCGGV